MIDNNVCLYICRRVYFPPSLTKLYSVTTTPCAANDPSSISDTTSIGHISDTTTTMVKAHTEGLKQRHHSKKSKSKGKR